MARTTTKATGVSFVADWNSVERDMGRDFDWANANSLESFPAGTVVSLLATGLVCPRLYQPGVEGAYGILISDVDKNANIGAQGVGVWIAGSVLEQLLPEYTDAAWATIKAELTNFTFLKYEDNRA